MTIKEGYMPFKEFKTYYRIVGEEYLGKKPPLLLLHGGPGSTHNYFEVMDELADKDERALIMYDQIGCGNSFVPNRPDLWNKETWAEELIELRKFLNLDEVHILGQSWGGMLAIIYACDYKPEGVKSIILSSTLASAKLWSIEQHRRIAWLSPEDQAAIKKAEDTGNFDDPDYLKANDHFMIRHCAPVFDESWPEPLWRKKVSGSEAYVVGWGPNEYTPTGTLGDYEYTDKLHTIKEPVLITDGVNDLCSPLVAKEMYDHIPGSKWELFGNSRHMPFVEEPEKYFPILLDWMNEND
ncbi:MAG: proline iminopeptidase-family hydrolase [Lachnospiraceae bacterium]|jgi:proline iminopeptidase|nr:proline iminopeptidase-family hydrolase [Lachnospiraceae bacterium]